MSLPPFFGFESYQPKCSEVDFKDFSKADALRYDPEDEDYLEDLFEDKALPGIIIAGICLVIGLALIIWSLILCCVRHEWNEQRSLFSPTAHSCRKFFSFILITLVLVFTFGILALGSWGIYETVKRVDDAVDESFDFIKDTDVTIGSIRNRTDEATDVGWELVDIMKKVNSQAIVPGLVNTIATMEDALNTADEEIENTLADFHDFVKDGVEYEDDGDDVSKILTVLIAVCFSVFMVTALILGIISVFGKAARLTYCWVVFMWVMLFIAFALGVGVLNVLRKFSEDSCLSIDEFAIRHLKDEVDSVDSERMETLLRFYFQPVGTNNLSPLQIETLWDLPLSDIDGFVDTVDSLLFTPTGDLSIIGQQVTGDTRRSLLQAKDLFPVVRTSLDDIRSIISGGGVLNEIHAGLKDLLCCTYYDSVSSVFIAWCTSSVAGFILAVLVTWQALASLKMVRDKGAYSVGPPPPEKAAPVVGNPAGGPQGQSAYMGASRPTVNYPAIQHPLV